MAADDWTSRVSRPGEMREGHVPAGNGPAFAEVAEVVLLGTAVAGGAVDLVHLWKTLARHHPIRRPVAESPEEHPRTRRHRVSESEVRGRD